MAFDSSLPHQLPWNYPWIKDEIERRDEYIAQLEAELAHQKPQNGAHGAIEGETVKIPAEDETEAHSEPDSREKLLGDLERLTQTWHDYDGNFMRVYGGVAYAQVKELLDRQASITANDLTSESDVPKPTELGEIDTSKDDMRDFNDSREKLEADMAAWLNDNLCVDCYDADIAYGWLDRQAAITERSFRELREDLTADNLWMHERIAELQSQLEVAQGVNERQDLDYIEQKRRIDELEHQRTVMAKKLMCAERDRDRYRAALGKAIDCADEIRRLS